MCLSSFLIRLGLVDVDVLVSRDVREGGESNFQSTFSFLRSTLDPLMDHPTSSKPIDSLVVRSDAVRAQQHVSRLQFRRISQDG